MDEEVVAVEAKGKEPVLRGLGGRTERVEADASATRSLVCCRARAGERRAGFGDVARNEADLCVYRDEDLAATGRAGDAPRVVFDLDLPTVALGISASTAAPAAA